MMNLETYLAEYDRSAAMEEAARAAYGEDYTDTYAYAGEDATLIPADLVVDPDLCTVWGYGSDHRVLVLGQDD